MLLTLLCLAIVAIVLLVPTLARVSRTALGDARKRQEARRSIELADLADPGRERRAEQRARELLRSCVNDEEWAMYRDLGFIRVRGRMQQPERGGEDGARRARGSQRRRGETGRYAYLIYPHKPVVAFLPETGRLLAEYCVEFPDLTAALGSTRLPSSDDVLAKWMALTGDEERLLHNANMHLVGRQVDPGRVRRDLWRLAQWEREWQRTRGQSAGGAGSAERQRT